MGGNAIHAQGGGSGGVFRETPDGIVLAVRASPRSSRPGVDGFRNGALAVRLRSAPADGKANAELVEVLAEAFGVPKRSVEPKSGLSSRAKTVLVRTSSPASSFAFLHPAD